MTRDYDSKIWLEKYDLKWSLTACVAGRPPILRRQIVVVRLDGLLVQLVQFKIAAETGVSAQAIVEIIQVAEIVA